MTTTKKYALPILAIVASIVIMTIPSALAVDGQPTIEELYEAIASSEDKIASLQENLVSAQLLLEHRINSVAAHQVMIDRVESGGVLTDDQIALYDATVAEIEHLQLKIADSIESINGLNNSILSHQSTIDRVQELIDSREA